MKTTTKIASYFVFALLGMLLITHSPAAEYASIEGVESTDAVFDFRIGDPETALAHFGLIHDMIKDPNMRVNDTQPEIIIVFVGPSVKLVSTESEFEAGKQKHLGAVADKISEMSDDGIRFVICMTAAHVFDIDPDTILPEVDKVRNGWITLIGYQQQGYAMIANF